MEIIHVLGLLLAVSLVCSAEPCKGLLKLWDQFTGVKLFKDHRTEPKQQWTYQNMKPWLENIDFGADDETHTVNRRPGVNLFKDHRTEPKQQWTYEDVEPWLENIDFGADDETHTVNRRPANNKKKPKRTISTSSAPPQVRCQESVSKTTMPGFVCKGQLLFEDNFDYKLEKENIWKPEIMFPGEPEYPFNVYLNEHNLLVSDGKLKIKPIILDSIYGADSTWQSLDLSERCTGVVGTMECSRVASGPQILPPIITAKVTTKQKFSFKYGRIEIGATMPLGDWLVPEIQLEPRDHIYGTQNYASGLLRIACVKGNFQFAKRLYAGPILSSLDSYRNSYLREKNGFNHWYKAQHNYTLEWRPDGISMFVDGEKYGEINPGIKGFSHDVSTRDIPAAAYWRRSTVMAPFDDMFYISLGLSVGGIHEFAKSRNKPWTNTSPKAMLKFWMAQEQWLPTWHYDTSSLQIDFVRVYAL